MRRTWRNPILLILALLGLGGASAFISWAWRPSIALDPRPQTAFDAAEIVRGAELAAIGNCNVCHTKDGAPPYAGGRPIPTPFGTVFTTNITPDMNTGIGGWPPAAFTRAMRDGVSRDGRHLYPAFPYDHMTKMQESDIRAVYAFIMTRPPVHAAIPANDLPFPYNLRPLLAGWKLLFLHRGAERPDPGKSADWNRGAYLVEGLGHCGACHTPRNALGAESRGQAYAGGNAEGWVAPALNADSPAAVPWDAERLYRYLRLGFDDTHGLAAGPMAPVVRNLAAVPDADVRAISIYVAALAGAPSPARERQASQAIAWATGETGSPRAGGDAAGAALYAGTCAQCHGEAGRVPAIRALHLTFSSSLRMPRPDNLIRIVRDGVHQPGAVGEPVMPGFGNVLSDTQLVALVSYLRAAFTDHPAWTEIEQSVRQIRESDAETQRAQQKASLP